MMTKEAVLNEFSEFFNLYKGFQSLREAQIFIGIPDDKFGFEQRLKIINDANPDLDIDFLKKFIEATDDAVMEYFKMDTNFEEQFDIYLFYFKETRKAFGYENN